MNLKWITSRLALISMLMIVFTLVLASASPQPGPYADSIVQPIIISDDEYLTALLTHDLDAGAVKRPGDLSVIQEAGFTVNKMTRLGYVPLFENNRVWPFGEPYRYRVLGDVKSGYPDPDNPPDLKWRAEQFRKGVHRLLDKDAIVEVFAPLMSKADYWLPPGQAAWIDPESTCPTFNPGNWDDVYEPGVTETASAYLNWAGFIAPQDGEPNPDYNPGKPWSTPTMRIDPYTGETLEEFEYYVIGPTESPLGFEMAQLISYWLHLAGIKHYLTPGTWLGMVYKLTSGPLEDWTFMTGVGIAWASTAPDILYDFTFSESLPLWNFVYMNYTTENWCHTYEPHDPFETEEECLTSHLSVRTYCPRHGFVHDDVTLCMDYWGLKMMETLDVEKVKECAHMIQRSLRDHEPYMPLLLDEGFTVFAGPHDDQSGYIGVVNADDWGALGIAYGGPVRYLLRPPVVAGGNMWAKILGRSGRIDPVSGVESLRWGLNAYLDTLNPLMADIGPDWMILAAVEDALIELNPYTHAYMPWAAEEMPLLEEWTGTHRYDSASDTLVADDPPAIDGQEWTGKGMATTWKLRDDLYWHDSDPGADGLFGTADDGYVMPVTAYDFNFTANLMIRQHVERYYGAWSSWDSVVVHDERTFTLYERRRSLFAFEAHGIGMFSPKHVWEVFIAGPDRMLWTGDDRHHGEWFGWQEPYMECPIHPGQMLTKLIGFGPFHYHLGGWEPGVSAHVEANTVYFGGKIDPGDVNLDQIVAGDDWYKLKKTFGASGKHPQSTNWDPACDIAYPAQTIGAEEIALLKDHFGNTWGP